MKEIKYNLSGGWIAPPISILLDKEGYVKALNAVISCQRSLGYDLSKLDMTTNEGHSMLYNATLVSSQLRLYRQSVVDLIEHHVDPVQGQAIGVNPVEMTTPKNRGDKSTPTRNYRGARG